MRDFMIRFSRIFLILIIVNSIISIGDDLNGMISGHSFLENIRFTINSLVFLNSIILILFMVFSEVIPAIWFSPFILTGLIKFLLTVPLRFYASKGLEFEKAFSGNHYVIINHAKWFGFIFILFSVIDLLYAFYLKLDQGKLVFNKDSIFSVKRTLIIILAAFIIVSVSAGPYTMTVLVSFVNNLTNGFLEADFNSFYSIEKIFEKNGTKISLLGMIHIGDADFYKSVSKEISGKNTLILPEGISDSENLLKIKPDYKNLSSAIGLDTQAENLKIDKEKVEIKHVDIDTSEFDEVTVRIINSILKVLESENAEEMQNNYIESNRIISEYNGMHYIRKDVIEKRNSKITSAIDKYAGEYDRIFVPWGALHLNDIEKHLVGNGYTLENTVRRKVFDWNRIFQKLVELKEKTS